MTSLGADEQIQQLNMFTITHCLSLGFLVYEVFFLKASLTAFNDCIIWKIMTFRFRKYLESFEEGDY